MFGICLSAVCQDGVACLVYVSVQFAKTVLHVWYMFECSLPRRCCMFGICLGAVCQDGVACLSAVCQDDVACLSTVCQDGVANCTQRYTKHATPSWQTALKHTQANGVPLVFHRHVKSHPRTFMFQYVSKSIHHGVASRFYNMLALEHNIMK